MHRSIAFLLGLALVSPLASSASTASDPATKAWNDAREWRVSQTPVALPEGGLRISLDSATLELTSGTLRPFEPVLGRATGFVFEGRGHFVMEVPDVVELDQLRRFLGEAAMNRFEAPVERVVFRSSAPVPGLEPGSAFEASSLARDRHIVWLAEEGVDIDARLIETILNDEGPAVTRVDLQTPQHGWLTYSFEPIRQEEVELAKTTSAGSERWISLDQSGERSQDGRPSSEPRNRLDLESVDLDIDLTRRGRWGNVGYAMVRSANGKMDGTVRLVPQQSGLRAITLSISPSAEIKSITVAGGAEIGWLRDQIGERAAKIEDDTWAPWFTVLLPEPTVAGTPIELAMSWEMHLPAFAAGVIWYPTPAEDRLDPLTGRLRFRTIRRQDVRSSGRRTEAGRGDDRVIEYVIDRPMKMLGFVIGERFIEQEIPGVSGVPPIIAWGPPQGLGSRAEVRNVAVDVHNSVRFFSWLLDDPITAEEIVISGIASGHGQSFDGFIQMAEYTFGHDSRGPTEMFRAHEVAHQWFGHRVAWVSDRDQWLSESLSEYAAMMFVQATVEGGDRLFQEILDTYTNILFGSLRGAAGRFARPGLLEMNDSHRERVGPIGHGIRASTIEVPTGYQLQAYHKGPLVVHMLRLLLGYKYPGDEMFVRILRAYVKENAEGAATTASFRQIVERETESNWGWFFDQWIDRAAIPEYRWSWDAVQVDGSWKVRMNVRQSGVPADFMMPVPVRIELPGREKILAVMGVRGAESTAEFAVPARPSKVIFNPDRAVLAETRQD